MLRSNEVCKARRTNSTRQGSTLLIVVALLGMMAFLGFVFYTFAKQERAAALSFAAAAKSAQSFVPDVEAEMDFALQQIILGPPDNNTQSILWGGRHSLLANMYGRDGIPFNGEGVNLYEDATGMPFVDMDYNGSVGANDNQNLLNIVDGPMANATWNYTNGVWGAGKQFRGAGALVPGTDIPEPDADYNSPDINSVFLSYDGTAVNPLGGNPSRVIIPSFLRPQYLRTPGSPAATTTAQWFVGAPANQMMRPHPQHACVDGSGNVISDSGGGGTYSRYVGPTEYTLLGLSNPFFTNQFWTPTSTFSPFAPPTTAAAPGSSFLGPWNGAAATLASNGINQYEYDLDVDTDGDGVADAILMDLGYPPVSRSDGTLVVPLFAISIRDLNGLINLNAAGNLNGNINLGVATNPLTPQNQLGFRQNAGTWSGSWTNTLYAPDNISKSNLGLSTYEINGQRGLAADPTYTSGAPNDPTLNASSAATELSYFLSLFDSSVTTSPAQAGRSVIELANLEWLLLNIGRADFSLVTSTITNLYSGRFGELTRFQNFLTTRQPLDQPHAGLSVTWLTAVPPAAPVPQNWTDAFVPNPNPDDNLNYDEGELYYRLRYQTPLDFKGTGRIFPLYSWGHDGQPGAAGIDDDRDGVIDNLTEEGWIGSSVGAGSDDAVLSPSYVAPTPTYGKVPALFQLTNNYWLTTGTPTMDISKATSANPLFWPMFLNYHSYGGPGTLLPTYGPTTPFSTGGVTWGEFVSTSFFFFPQYNPATYGAASNPYPGQSLLMRGSQKYSLLDDPTELITDSTLLSPAYFNFVNSLTTGATPLSAAEVAAITNAQTNDAPLTVQESLFLQGTPADMQLANLQSTAAQLMPANLSASQFAADIRKRFTTVSKDRREFGVGNSLVGGLRSWESSTSFPPSLPSVTTTPNPNPYRPELYYYLEQLGNSISGNLNTASLKLNVNRWLFLDALTNNYGFAPLPEQTSAADANATTARQDMARDIYTLLYTLCFVHSDGTNVDVDYRTVSSTNVPTAAQAKEMAQFAVNLVDALDSDSIITAFYYDPDLSSAGGGWNQIYGPNGVQDDPSSTPFDDTVVYGVERQLLAFSEAQVLNVKQTTGNIDSPMTIFDDSKTVTNGRLYAYFELQNVSPTNVTLASSTVNPTNVMTTADWRVRLAAAATAETTYSSVYFLPGLNTTANTNAASNGVSADSQGNIYLTPSQVFTVSSQDGTDTISPAPSATYRTSDFRVDPNGTNTQFSQVVIPKQGFKGPGDTAGRTDSTVTTPAPPTVPPTNGTAAGSFPPPWCNLDLAFDYGDGPASPSRFVVQNSSHVNQTIPGSLLTPLVSTTVPTAVRFILERRAAAGGTLGSIWVPVDKTQNAINAAGVTSPAPTLPLSPDVQVGTIVPPTAPPTVNATIVSSALSGSTYNSYPRTVPLLRNSAYTVQGQSNTLNSASTLNPTVAWNANSIPWQLQNDREFGSLGELLELPLYGSDQLTAAIAQVINPGILPATLPTISASEFYTSTVGGTTTYAPSVAAGRFLRPDNPDYTANSATPNYGNRWYRLFDFLEVPNRSHQHQAILGIPPAPIAISPATAAVTLIGPVGTNGSPVTFSTPGVPGATSYSAYTGATAANCSLLAGSFNLPQYFGWPTTNGLINLNMIRHPEALNALLDNDQVIFDPRWLSYTQGAIPITPPTGYVSAGASANRFLASELFSMDPNDQDSSGNPRIWFLEFLKSRESRFNATAPFVVDPVVAQYVPGGLYMPGTANSRPFRSMDTVGQLAVNTTTNDSPIENTIFRSLPMDATTTTNANASRRLFEVGNPQDHQTTIQNEVTPPVVPPASTPTYPLHPVARHQLLSKIMNNTTTRSNTFAVYITVQYYEAVELPGVSAAGNVTAIRVGGQITSIPPNRSFFVIDRTGAVDQVRILKENVAAGTVAPTSTTFPVSPLSYSFSPNTDNSGLRAKMNGIRWQDLVLYRQTLN